MTTVKLFTEEQVRKAYKNGNLNGFDGFSDVRYLDDCINSLTPIELPTMKEIEKEAKDKNPILYTNPGEEIFTEGAAWVVVSLLEQTNKTK